LMINLYLDESYLDNFKIFSPYGLLTSDLDNNS